MRTSSLRALLSLATFGALAITAGACGGGGGRDDENGILVDNGFESDDPSGKRNEGSASGGNADAGAAAPSAGSDESSKDAERAVEEADIIKVEGNRLYALSRYGGLAIVDVTNPDHMTLLGRKRTDGIPFEMYVRNGRAFVMMNDFGRWISSAEGSPYGGWVQTSEILALDVNDPAAISESAHFDVPGSIADSRVVGDALYLVTYENGYCWRCTDKPGTVVTSFNIGGSAIAQVTQLEFRSPSSSYSWWQRSVSATNQRLYIAGPEWNWQPGANTGSSVIQVVDISDATGLIHKGADVPVAGQITNRWQMDEHAGVLRVVSQFGNGWGNNANNPKVQTFTVNSASSITPLGSTELILPKPESLRSVRFDGTRGYAITAERTDPLFTIDLSNPAMPHQAGELEMPGWIMHMEPRGDRLIGFGYDDTVASNARLAVSLFDVSNLAAPTMLKRVSFGEGWGSLAEDQDRIHKSVRVLDDQGLVLVPFASYPRWDGTDCSKSHSGIQLIDFSRDDLTLRGIAPQYGMPRRALMANGRLLGISDRSVTSFDITSRDTPVKKNEIDLSNPSYRLVELPNHIASLTNDWWSGEAMISLTPKANADDAQTSGKVSLANLVDDGSSYCGRTGAWAAWYSARLFANGNFVYVSVPIYTYGENKRGGRVIVASIDVSNPAAPVIVGKSTMNLTERSNAYYYGYYGSGFWDGYGYYSSYNGIGALVGSGESIVQVGTKLAYLELDTEVFEIGEKNGMQRYDSKVHRKLHVADFTNPAAPVVHAPIDLGESLGYAPLLVQDSVVLTSRWIPGSSPYRVRFFADRVDLAGTAPQRLASLNTPGSLLAVDAVSNRFVTADYTASRTTASDWQSCVDAQGYRAIWNGERDCVKIDRSFKLADVSGTRVTLRQTFAPPSQNIDGVRVAEDRVYITGYRRYDYAASRSSNGEYVPPTITAEGGLWALGGIREGNLAIVSQMSGDAKWPLAAHGTKIALYTDRGLSIYDTATPAPTLVADAALRGWGYSTHVLLSNDHATCSLGEWGLQTIRY